MNACENRWEQSNGGRAVRSTVPVVTSCVCFWEQNLETCMVGGLKSRCGLCPWSWTLTFQPYFAFGALSLVLNTHLVISPTSRSQLISFLVPFSPALNIPPAHTSRLLVDCSVWQCNHTGSTSSKPAPLFPTTTSNIPLLMSHRQRPSTPWLFVEHDVPLAR